ncbi:MAG: M23 family metallopeptidase [Gemmatimonadota bacterium]
MRSLSRARAIAYGAMALFGVGAVMITSPLPRASELPALATRGQARAASELRVRFDTLGSRETLVHVLGRAGISARDARAALATKLLEPGRIRVGMPVQTRSRLTDTAPTEILLGLAIDRILHLRRNGTGWTGEVEQLLWTTDTIVVSGVVTSHLYAAMNVAARDVLADSLRDRLTYALADLYEFRVDMSRDLRVGDSFRVVSEREHGPSGAVRVGRIVAATMKLSGTTIDAIPFKSANAGGEFFDGDGRPLRCCFLRAPLEFRRISGRFGLRRHPILGTTRRHEGMDYAASSGTRVRAIGDGVVIRAGWTNGYGNTIDLRHPNGFVSRYGHMQGFAKGVRAGTRVAVGRTIGFVGSTGLSTGPHLHFEVLVNGRQRDPRQAFGKQSIKPIPDAERRAFVAARDQARELLGSPARFATADTSSAKRATQQ